ncbi:hypothetical protein BDB01DRAFT_240048 [Pilobolus umbonatus]|nr:hypothetical protein BDB01DRAFT_240048 [Pilobolus umbonatus]
MDEPVTIEYTVLFTAQKLKKFKTWQDGTLKFHRSSKKLILVDEKGYNIDSKFHRGGEMSLGEEVEFDRHIVTIEAFLQDSINQDTPVAVQPSLSHSRKRTVESEEVNESIQRIGVPRALEHAPVVEEMRQLRKRARMGLSKRMTAAVLHRGAVNNTYIPYADNNNMNNEQSVDIPSALVINNPPASSFNNEAEDFPLSSVDGVEPSAFTPASKLLINEDTSTSDRKPSSIAGTPASDRQPSSIAGTPAIDRQPSSTASRPSRNDIPRASMTESSTHALQRTSMANTDLLPSTSKPFKPPFTDGVSTPSILKFPSHQHIQKILQTKKYPKRSKTVPTRFTNTNAYRDSFIKIIYEHLEIMLVNYGIYYFTMYEKFGQCKQGNELERTMRSKGIGFYSDCVIKGNTRPVVNDRRFRIMIKSKREHYSKYNKDDIWVISRTPTLDPSQSFLSKSTYYSPFADGTLELDCISSRDGRIATKMIAERCSIYALRTLSASTEFLMCDTLEDRLENIPLLPYILSDNKPRKGKNREDKVNLPVTGHIKLTEEDNIDMEKRLADTITRFNLNSDQESVLRRVAQSAVYSPHWKKEVGHPVVLVHGVYGSGKRYISVCALFTF